jgi:hypothetical protein
MYQKKKETSRLKISSLNALAVGFKVLVEPHASALVVWALWWVRKICQNDECGLNVPFVILPVNLHLVTWLYSIPITSIARAGMATSSVVVH